MTDEMVQVKQNVNTFANTIGQSGLDFRVIFIVRKGTSGNTICVPPPLGGANCADNLPTFRHVDQSVGSNNSLSLVLSTYENANANLAWKGNLRPDAFKAFVEVTDDEATGTQANAFDAALLDPAKGGMFGTGSGQTAKRNYIFHSIVNWKTGNAPPSSVRCSTRDGGTGVEYQKLSLLTGGLIDEVCKTDYSGVLNNIAKGIVDRLACSLTYPKNEAADPTKLVVQYTPTNKPPANLTQVTDATKCAGTPDGWHYDDNANPSQIILCKTTCDTINNEGGKISALVGCKAPAPK